MGDLLRVDDVEVMCVIGVYPEERLTPQPLRLSLALRLSLQPAARSGQLNDTVDYARLCGQLSFVLQRAAFSLLETAAEALVAVVFASTPLVEEVTLTLKKPGALGHNGIPALSLVRRRMRHRREGMLWPGPDASIHWLSLSARGSVSLSENANVLDVHAGRQGVVVDHDGAIVAPGEPRLLLVVTVPPAGEVSFTSLEGTDKGLVAQGPDETSSTLCAPLAPGPPETAAAGAAPMWQTPRRGNTVPPHGAQ